MKKILFFNLFFCTFGSLVAQIQPSRNTDEVATEVKPKKNIGHWIFAGIGLGLTGYGLSEQQKADDLYNEQYLSQTSRSAGTEFFNEANDTHKKGANLIYAGAAVLLTDAIVFVIKKRKRKKNAALDKKLSLRSSYTPAEGIQMGFSINIGK